MVGEPVASGGRSENERAWQAMNPMQPSGSPDPNAPYGAPPATSPTAALSSINLAAFTAPQNRGYLIAAIGGLVALLSFLLFPFWGISYQPPLTARSTSMTALSAASSYALLWLVALGALVALAAACLLALDIKAIAQLTPQLGARVIIGSGIIALLFHLITAQQLNGDIALYTGLRASDLSKSGISYGVGFGFWLMLLAFIAVIVGGVMSMRQT